MWQQLPEALRFSQSPSIMMSSWPGRVDSSEEGENPVCVSHIDVESEVKFKYVQSIIKELRNIRAGSFLDCDALSTCLNVYNMF